MNSTIEQSTVLDVPPSLDVEALAKLSPVEYDRLRESTAKLHGIRIGTLDALVSDSRRAKTDNHKLMMFKLVEPWPAPVNPAQMLDTINSTMRRFIICESETAHAATLWIALTWLIEYAQVFPLAIITAPEMRCGKSQCLDFMGRLSRKPLVTSNISPAAIFRVIEAHSPTLLVDECDTFLRENEEARGIINSGHTRQSAFVIRTTGDDHEPTPFSTWSAKVLCGIGTLHPTLMDRAILLELRRKLATETVERLRHAEPGLFDRLASMLARFADDCGADIAALRPALPEQLNDRAQDNWEPLLQIADYAGGHWPETARKAALKISGEKEAAQSVSTELLADIQSVFEEKRTARIYTASLIEALIADDEKSWQTYNRGRPLSPKQLANRLKEYGIASKAMRIGGELKKGFELVQFADAFARYLTPAPEKVPLHVTNTHKAIGSIGLGVTGSVSSAVTNANLPLQSSVDHQNVTGKRECNGTENSAVTQRSPVSLGLHENVTCSGKNPGANTEAHTTIAGEL